MTDRILRVLVLMVLATVIATASGGHGAGAPRVCDLFGGFRIAEPGYVYQFPRDHGAHNDYQTEWWYYTGHLFGPQQQEFGYELTFFRIATVDPAHRAGHRSHWFADQLYLAHLAVSDIGRGTFHFAERTNRAGMGAAGARTGRLDVWNDDWLAQGLPESDSRTKVHLAGRDGAEAIDLTLESRKPVVIQGEDGISRKGPGPGNASHYYSLTRMDTQGTLQTGGQSLEVHGLTWMDHEFGSSQLSGDEVGWDWVSVQMDDDTELMLYHMRQSNGQPDPNSSGTLIDAHGHTTPLKQDAFSLEGTGQWKSPHSGGTYPMGWKIHVPSAHLDLDLQPLLLDQELMTGRSTGVTYWEGTVKVAGSREGKPVTGRGYVEMTGYGKKLGL